MKMIIHVNQRLSFSFLKVEGYSIKGGPLENHESGCSL